MNELFEGPKIVQNFSNDKLIVLSLPSVVELDAAVLLPVVDCLGLVCQMVPVKDGRIFSQAGTLCIGT